MEREGATALLPAPLSETPRSECPKKYIRNAEAEGSNPFTSTGWHSPLRPDRRYESLVVSYQEVVHAPALCERVSARNRERLLAGERISKVSNETGVSPATLHRWKDQALIDAGLKEGTKSIEVDELAQARKTIQELEAELAAVKLASALFNGEEPSAQKGCQVAEAEQPGLLRACGQSCAGVSRSTFTSTSSTSPMTARSVDSC